MENLSILKGIETRRARKRRMRRIKNHYKDRTRK